jgi:uncharacterized protein YndB with AHSA1/START domain
MSESDFEHTGRVIRDEIRIEAPADAVYRAWSDPETISAWFVGRMEGRMEPGETVTWSWADEDPGMRQRVLLADAPRRFVTEMELPQGASVLEVVIEQDGGHSVVRLVQSGFGEGPEWDDEFEGMLSGWMMALGVLKLFVERYLGRQRREILVLGDAPFDREGIVELQRTEQGLARWLSRSGSVGRAVGEPVKLVLDDGRTLTGTVLRTTRWETLWSWDEIDGVVEIKAFRAAQWGSKVGVRISSWLGDAAELADVEGCLTTAVERLVEALSEG